jgi:hypothetical protein
MEIEVILAVATLVGAITTVLGFVAGSRERKATVLDKSTSAASNIADAYDKLNSALEERIVVLEKQLEEAIKENKIHWDNSVKSIEKQNVIIRELKAEIAVLKKENEELLAENADLKMRIKQLENAGKKQA